MATKKNTPAQIEEMRALVAAADAEQAEADRIGRVEYMKPMVDFVSTTEFIFVRDTLAALAKIYRGDDYAGQSVSNNAFGLSWMSDVSAMDLTKPDMPEIVEVVEPENPPVTEPEAQA